MSDYTPPERFVRIAANAGEAPCDCTGCMDTVADFIGPVLADLRRQVTEWRESSIVGRRSFVLSDGTDSIMSAWHNGRTDMADAVLDLLATGGSDEA